MDVAMMNNCTQRRTYCKYYAIVTYVDTLYPINAYPYYQHIRTVCD